LLSDEVNDATLNPRPTTTSSYTTRIGRIRVILQFKCANSGLLFTAV